ARDQPTEAEAESHGQKDPDGEEADGRVRPSAPGVVFGYVARVREDCAGLRGLRGPRGLRGL
ncbi:hypothetical protein, partial [Streptomyces sp. NPDC006999]|uniref:hypothetical protein n=1 Tax=Streptomyces sp. NPDC006999 TaxID=3156909 RepID=UPI00340CB443